MKQLIRSGSPPQGSNSSSPLPTDSRELGGVFEQQSQRESPSAFNSTTGSERLKDLHQAEKVANFFAGVDENRENRDLFILVQPQK